jgi:hypothetical protein
MTRSRTSRAHDQALETRLVDEVWERHAWHGPNLRAVLRGVTAAQASWRPAGGRHNIWELVRHLTYWTFTARRRLGHDPGRFAYKGSNWFAVPGVPDERSWRDDVARLAEETRRLRDALEGGLPPSPRATVRSAADRLTLLLGIACHGAYHAGQIQLLKRLQPRA